MVAHTIFTASPFRPKGSSLAMVSANRTGQQLGFTHDELDFLTQGLDALIDQAPIGVLRDSYSTRRTECMAKSTFRKYGCLYDLLQDIKDDAKSEGRDLPPLPTAPAPTPPKADTFPWVPVAIAAGLGTGALVYFVLRKSS